MIDDLVQNVAAVAVSLYAAKVAYHLVRAEIEEIRLDPRCHFFFVHPLSVVLSKKELMAACAGFPGIDQKVEALAQRNYHLNKAVNPFYKGPTNNQ